MNIKWNKVTWYSKLLAAILFLGVFPALTFYIGREIGEINCLVSTPQQPSTSLQNISARLEVNKNTDISKIAWGTFKDSSGYIQFQYPQNWMPATNKNLSDGVSFTDPKINRYEGPRHELEVVGGASIEDINNYVTSSGQDLSTTTGFFMVGNKKGMIVNIGGIDSNFGVIVKTSDRFYLFSFPPKYESEIGNIEKYILWSVKFLK